MFTPYTMIVEDYDGNTILSGLSCQYKSKNSRIGNSDAGHEFIEKCEIITTSTLSGVSIGDFCVVTHEDGTAVGSWEIESITPKSLSTGFNHNFIVGIKSK